MDNLQKFISDVRNRFVAVLLVDNAVVLANWWIAEHVFKLSGIELLVSVVVVSIIGIAFLPWLTANYITQPTKLIWQAILHIAPDATNVSAPDLKQARLGRELVTSLVGYIYQLASVVENVEKTASNKSTDLHANTIAQLLPLPLLVLGADQTILFANEQTETYLKLGESEIINKNAYSVLDMSFQTDQTFDAWLSKVKTSTVTADETWEHVRLKLADEEATVRQCDLAAHYSQANPQGYETVLLLFDHASKYGNDDQELSFVALAVHELRTPLTLLRGYIEALEEEVGNAANIELVDFIHKMDASAQQLTTFVSNILNVARIETDQLIMELHEANWKDIVTAVVHDMNMRAQVHGITIQAEIAANLPTVAIDRVSMYEVLTNLLDNAIKYSGSSKDILVKSSLTQGGIVETTVQDYGIGIPESALSSLFAKFYRDYHHRSQIGGTGLGLYLSKTIITAHSGNLWVRSKEGQGATFGFTLLPYSKLAAGLKNKDNSDIVRSAHGWIKNHSLYRR